MLRVHGSELASRNAATCPKDVEGGGGGGGGGNRYLPVWGGAARLLIPHTSTLFKTNIADFPTLFKTEF